MRDGRTLALIGLALSTAVLLSCSSPNRITEDESGAGAGTGAEASSCRERVDASLAAIEAVRREHLTCGEASDCTLFDPSTLCLGGCPLPVAASGLDAARGAVDAANRGVCESFRADGCPFATPGCVQVFADCVDDRCVTTTEPPGAE